MHCYYFYNIKYMNFYNTQHFASRVSKSHNTLNVNEIKIRRFFYIGLMTNPKIKSESFNFKIESSNFDL